MINVFTPHIERFFRAVRFASEYRVKEILTVIICITTVGLGTTFLLTDTPYSPVLLRLDQILDLQVWGVILVVLAVMLSMAAAIGRRYVMWPAFFLFITYGILTVLAALVPNTDYVVPAGAWGFLLAAMVSALVTATSAFTQFEDEHKFGSHTIVLPDINK